jgi:hypothetical protein
MLLLRDGTRTMTPRTDSALTLRQDLLLALFLVVLCVVMRLVPHVSNFSPVAAAALFAGMTIKTRWLAIAVPLAAMLASDAFLGGYGWQMMAVVYGALALPAVIGIFARCARLLADLLPGNELRGVGAEHALLAGLPGPARVLRRGAAVPEIHGCRRPVLERGAVRRRGPAAAAHRALRGSPRSAALAVAEWRKATRGAGAATLRDLPDGFGPCRLVAHCARFCEKRDMRPRPEVRREGQRAFR